MNPLIYMLVKSKEIMYPPPWQPQQCPSIFGKKPREKSGLNPASRSSIWMSLNVNGKLLEVQFVTRRDMGGRQPEWDVTLIGNDNDNYC